jgi:hypothetical protein
VGEVNKDKFEEKAQLIRIEDEKMDSREGILVFLCVGVIKINLSMLSMNFKLIYMKKR